MWNVRKHGLTTHGALESEFKGLQDHENAFLRYYVHDYGSLPQVDCSSCSAIF